MASVEQAVQVRRWSGAKHPSMSAITRLMQSEGLRPYMWMNMPNTRQAVRSHGYNKVLYVIEGAVEVILPDSNQRVTLRAGDRMDVPAGVRHGTHIGAKGAKCVEASITRRRRRTRR